MTRESPATFPCARARKLRKGKSRSAMDIGESEDGWWRNEEEEFSTPRACSCVYVGDVSRSGKENIVMYVREIRRGWSAYGDKFVFKLERKISVVLVVVCKFWTMTTLWAVLKKRCIFVNTTSPWIYITRPGEIIAKLLERLATFCRNARNTDQWLYLLSFKR